MKEDILNEDILKVIAAARKAADEAPEATEVDFTSFVVKTSLGRIRCGKLDLWLDAIPIAGPLCDSALWEPISDLYNHLKAAWLRAKHVKAERGESELIAATEKLFSARRRA
jgi:hypothetical protein